MSQTDAGGSILVVDDNPLIVNVLKSLFASANYQVYCSNNGKEAAELLSKKEVDIIISDVMMPEMDGYDLHSYVRDRSELAHIPFVFLTALDSTEEKLSGHESGADDYLVKPFDPAELLAIVDGKIKRSRGLKNISEQQYDTYRKKIIHTLSHEFRTPLVAINTGTELLLDQQERWEKEKIKNLLEAIQRGGQRLEKLVTDFMLLQQIEAGIAERMYSTRHAVKDILDYFQQFIDSVKPRLEKQGYTVEYQLFAQQLWADIYEPHISDILERFTNNAVKFDTVKKQITFQLFPLGDEIGIEISDRGIGIDPDKIRQAIDPFGQIDRDKLEQQGGGLGLSIANRYAKINGGRIELERRPEGGTTARLILSRVRN